MPSPDVQEPRKSALAPGAMSESQAPVSEGPVAKAIEQQTAKLPSDLFLWGAVGSMVVSAALTLAGAKQVGNFVGQWVPTILILGLYNKLVKVAGSDRGEKGGRLGRV